MADDSNNTKAAFDKNRVSATEVGNHLTQSNCGDWNRARTIIRDALLGGCRAALEVDQGGQKGYIFPPPGFWFTPNRLRWVNALNPSMRREDYPDHSWPWELRAYLSPSESWELRDIEGRPLAQAEAGAQQAGEQARQALLMDLESYGIDPSAGRYAALDQARERVSMLQVFLPRTDAVRWGLLPALEFPQAVASEESPSPDKQLNDPAVGIQASARVQSTPEQPETPPPVPAPDTASKPIEPAAIKELASSSPSVPVASTEEPRKERSDEIAAPMGSQKSSESEWDPQSDWSVETVFRELGINGRVQRVIVETVPKIYGDSKTRELDRLVAKTPWPTADLRNAILKLLEQEAGKPLRQGEIPSWDACKDFLTAWHKRRARRP